MKVYYIGGKYMGCNYVRILLPMYHNGWKGNFDSLESECKPIEVMAREALEADVVVFHRAETTSHHRVAMLLKKAGKKIVFDNDDTFKFDEYHPFFEMDRKNFERNKKMKNNVINNFILNADLITCSTDFLQKEYQEINPNVHVLPNYVDPMDWDEPLRNTGDKVRIGVVGSVAYSHDFGIIEDVIKKLSKNQNIQLVLFGLNNFKKKEGNKIEKKILRKEYSFWENLKNIEHVPWVPMHQYFKMLNELRLDLMIIPRRENNFNRAKSNVKFLEAAMCEIPVIASSFKAKNSPYDADIDGTNGLLVSKHKDWYPTIMSLVNDKKKRRAMGKKAKKYVLTHYNIEQHAHKWAEVYKTLCQ